MTAEMLPGRPGTLTVEQEAKLRELWRATLHVFGVLEKGQSSRTSTDLLNGSAASLEAGSGEKHKKKRLGLFGRKKNSDTDSGPSTESSAGAPAGAEDKYGQTKQFHEALANQSPEVLRTTFWSMVKHDHPDALLLRFLRARKWDVEKALIMMVSTMNWRATEMHVDDEIIKSGEMGSIERSRSLNHVEVKLGEDFMAQIRMGKSFLHGVDKMGRPICIVRVRLHKQGEQSEESLERYTVFVIETARMILNPPIDTACVIFDMTGFSMANMDYTPVKFMIKCFEANYPESLGVVLVHKAPWIFQGIWKIIKGWLDPVVASKVHFTNSAADMEDFVTKDHILKELGGEEDWSYQYIEPLAGENDKMMDTEAKERFEVKRQKIVKTYEQDTLEWIETGTGPNAVEFMRKRNLAAAQLRVNYWELDPYIRARSIYDRSGMLQPGGRVQFYQGRETLSSAPVVNGAPVETSSADLD
ncbi:MAG: hypothetical protein M1818_003142 [Claussenomyces sp. TS43310]|nr:MAG: hypothetical protein M1818_003142 [Claussenomyces sp. TS43310]